MTDEERRILIAARERRLLINYAGRYVITGEARPDRKARERMQGKGWLGWHVNGQPTITANGRAALIEHGDHL